MLKVKRPVELVVMEDSKFQKRCQSYRDRRVDNRRFFNNKDQGDPRGQMPVSDNTHNTRQTSGNNVNCVKPRYSCEQLKDNEVKPEIVSSKEQYKPSSRGKGYHGSYAREQKSNPKYNERKYMSKEKNGRPFKISHTGKNQNKTNKTTKAEINEPSMTTQQEKCKIVNEPKSANEIVVQTTQYLKPALHVQPLQQHPEDKHRKTTERHEPGQGQKQGNVQLLSNDTSLQRQPLVSQHTNTSTVIGLKSEKDRSTRNGKITNSEQNSPPPETSERVAVKCAQLESSDSQQNSFGQDHSREFVGTKACGQSSDTKVLLRDIDSRSTVNSISDKVKTLDKFLPSNSCLPFADPARLQLTHPAEQSPTNSHINTFQSIAPRGIFERQLSAPTKEMTSEKAPLVEQKALSTTILETSRAQEQGEGMKRMIKTSGQVEHAHSLENLANEKYGYRISVDSLFSTSFFNCSQDVADLRHRNEHDEQDKVLAPEASTLDIKGNQTDLLFHEAPGFNGHDSSVPSSKEKPYLSPGSSFISPSLRACAPNYDAAETFDASLVSPRNRSGKDVKNKCLPEFASDPSFISRDINVETYKPLAGDTEHSFSNRAVPDSNLPPYSSVDISKLHEVEGKDTIPHFSQQLKHSEELNGEKKNLNNVEDRPGLQLQSRTYPSPEKEIMPTDSVTAEGSSVYSDMQLRPSTSERDQVPEKQIQSSVRSSTDDEQIQQRTSFSQSPYMPHPFLGHSLLTHRHAIPAAFVYPSRIGIPSSHSGFGDVGQHAVASPSSHLFPPSGTTVSVNVGGRLFEILPSTFSAYPDSILYQIFTGAVTPPINQRGHFFFDRDGYLFEIILAFARTGHLTLPSRVSLTSLTKEARFFGMYDYMFQQVGLPPDNSFHFQRTTCCTLVFDGSTNKRDTKVFVLQGEDKLKIESMKVSGSCHVYVDLYTPLGVKETSKFLLYNVEKPDLWKAYQFCAERQLVFYLERADNASISGRGALVDNDWEITRINTRLNDFL